MTRSSHQSDAAAPPDSSTRQSNTNQSDTHLKTTESHAMFYLQEELARTHMSDRLEEARAQRRGQQLAAAKRRARKAERAAVSARLALLRSL